MRKIKDSGVAWIGKIPETWEVTINKTILKNISERNHPDAEVLSLYRDLGVVPKNSRDDNHNVTSENTIQYKFVEKGSLVINKMKAWQGSLAVSNYEGIVSPAYYVCKFRDNQISKDYVHYLLRSSIYAQQFERLSTGMRIGQWDLSIDDFLATPLLVPPEKEQAAIAKCLDKKSMQIDALIANVQEQIEKLKAYKQSLITEVVTKGLDPNVPMKDSGVEWIGEIPEDWEVVKTGRLFKENNRSPIGNDIPLSLSQADGLVATDDMKESALKTSSYDNWKRVEIGDLVLNRFKAHLGVLFAANLTGIVSFHYGVYEAKRSLVPKFYEYLYHSNQYKAILGNASNGMVVGLQNLSNLGFYSTYSLYPPYAEQEKLVSHLDKKCSEIDDLITVKQAKIEKLEQYKRSLIYEYVTGKKEVS